MLENERNGRPTKNAYIHTRIDVAWWRFFFCLFLFIRNGMRFIQKDNDYKWWYCVVCFYLEEKEQKKYRQRNALHKKIIRSGLFPSFSSSICYFSEHLLVWNFFHFRSIVKWLSERCSSVQIFFFVFSSPFRVRVMLLPFKEKPQSTVFFCVSIFCVLFSLNIQNRERNW